MKVLTVMTLLPHVSQVNSGLRKQMSTKSTRIYQFTGDKPGNSNNIFTYDRLLTSSLADLDLNCGIATTDGRFPE
jgi:hypothetical protein